MDIRDTTSDDYYIVPARTLRGSLDEMLGELDDTIAGPMALRQLIAMRRTSKVPQTPDERARS